MSGEKGVRVDGHQPQELVRAVQFAEVGTTPEKTDEYKVQALKPQETNRGHLVRLLVCVPWPSIRFGGPKAGPLCRKIMLSSFAHFPQFWCSLAPDCGVRSGAFASRGRTEETSRPVLSSNYCAERPDSSKTVLLIRRAFFFFVWMTFGSSIRMQYIRRTLFRRWISRKRGREREDRGQGK